MAIYKLKSKRKYGDMPADYQFEVKSGSSPKPNAKDIENRICELGFNRQAQSYKSPGNFDIEKG